MKLIVGFIIGVLAVTVGFSGMAKIFDNTLTKIQSVAKEAAK
jgi:hypothetical protein